MDNKSNNVVKEAQPQTMVEKQMQGIDSVIETLHYQCDVLLKKLNLVLRCEPSGSCSKNDLDQQQELNVPLANSLHSFMERLKVIDGIIKDINNRLEV